MTTFLEEVIRDSYKLGAKVMAIGKSRKQTEAEMAEVRINLLKANRFVLDDEFIRVATEVGCKTNPMEVLQRLQGSLLPYERTWMEFNPRVKVETSRRVLAGSNPGKIAPIEETVDRMGLLLQRGEDSHQWSVTLFMPTKIMSRDTTVTHSISFNHGEMAVVSPASFLFDARGRDFNEHSKIGRVWTFRSSVYSCPEMNKIIRDKPDTEDMLIEMENVFKAELWGFWSSKDSAKARTVLPEILERHAAAGVSPFFRRMLVYFDKERRLRDLSQWLDQYRKELGEHTGLMRWLVGVLCILNEVPITVTEVKRTALGGRTRNLSNSQKRFDHSVVTLRLPRVKNVARYVSRKMIGGARKRRHLVEEHWRTYLSEAPCPIDAGLPIPVRHHRWEVDHDNGYRLCETCGSFSRLIHEHQRGDITLGWVTKEFNVTANLQKEETCSEQSLSE